MLFKPIVVDNLSVKYSGTIIDLPLRQNLSFVIGESGNGKTFIYKALEHNKPAYPFLEFFNYTSINNQEDIFQRISGLSKRLFVIDNCDIILNDELRKLIAFNTANQFILFGRNPRGLYLAMDNIYRVVQNGVNLSLERMEGR